jgi:YidC/Oxa1 family membrane protein insertase
VLNWLYTIVTWIVLHIHSALTPLFGANTGVNWGLSIVLLVIIIRLLLFPLFRKQIHTQRKMTELQPKVKELQAKHKGDRERLNQELMALYRENGANPLMGCLPLLLQMPVFFALFRVLRYITEDHSNGVFHYGWTASEVESAAHAKIFGVPLAVGFSSSTNLVHKFGADPTHVRIVTVIAIIIMAATTFITQRQMIVRNAASGNPMAQQQKIMLYVLPPMFALFGLNFQMGVLLYWVTSNIWSMGQQFFVIRAMHPPASGDGGGNGAKRKPAAPTPEPTVVIRRQQPSRQTRSKRAGKKR